jgi:pseudouridine kinase
MYNKDTKELRGYSMSKVVVVGGTNIDIFAYPHQKIVMKDSNPGYIASSLGGVGRNISENLARLGEDVTLITVLGRDEAANWVRTESKKIGLKLSIIEVDKTPSYIAIFDEFHEDLVSVAAMDQLASLDIDEILKRKKIIEDAELIVMDTNLSFETMDFIVSQFKHKIYVDAISSQKAIKIKPYLSKIFGLKLNIIEAELLTGIHYETMDDLNKMGDFLLEHGVKEVFITLGDQGAYYTNLREAIFRNAVPVKIKNSTGAGDAFFAGAIYAKLNDKNPLSYAMANAVLNLSDEKSVCSILTKDLLEKTVKELNL